MQRGVVKVIHIIRHGEATHNVARKTGGDEVYSHPAHFDAPLTEHGRTQARGMREVPIADLVVSSTLTRAIQTAELLYPRGGPDEVPIVCTDLARERHKEGHVCNHRHPLPTLRARHPYYLFTGPTEHDATVDAPSEDDDDAHRRATALAAELLARPEENIVVITHVTFSFSLQHALAPDRFPFWKCHDGAYVDALPHLGVRSFFFTSDNKTEED